MKPATWKVILALALLGTPLWSQRVSAPESREAVLQRTEALVKARPETYAEMPGGRPNPFAPMPEPEAPAAPAVVETATRAARLSDARALEAVARSFRPSGSLVSGERKLLRMPNGAIIREGNSFSAEIEGQSYRVTVTTVTPDGYTLSVGEASLPRRFIDTRFSSNAAARALPPPATPAESPDADAGE